MSFWANLNFFLHSCSVCDDNGDGEDEDDNDEDDFNESSVKW